MRVMVSCLATWLLAGCGSNSELAPLIDSIRSEGGSVILTTQGDIEEIDLSSTKATDSQLADIGTLASLQRIYLDSTGVTDKPPKESATAQSEMETASYQH